jgi:hypothetical protein
MPVTTPEVASTVPAAALLLLHVPPVDVLLSVVVAPTETVAVPVLAGRPAFTVTFVIAKQPAPNE